MFTADLHRLGIDPAYGQARFAALRLDPRIHRVQPADLEAILALARDAGEEEPPEVRERYAAYRERPMPAAEHVVRHVRGGKRVEWDPAAFRPPEEGLYVRLYDAATDGYEFIDVRTRTVERHPNTAVLAAMSVRRPTGRLQYRDLFLYDPQEEKDLQAAEGDGELATLRIICENVEHARQALLKRLTNRFLQE